MRLKTARIIAAGLATVVTAALTVVAPAPAHAGPCYTVTTGGQATTICPLD
jgi:hypothetical protein